MSVKHPLSDLGPGDLIYVRSSWYTTIRHELRKVDRVTKTQVIDDSGCRWNKAGGPVPRNTGCGSSSRAFPYEPHIHDDLLAESALFKKRDVLRCYNWNTATDDQVEAAYLIIAEAHP